MNPEQERELQRKIEDLKPADEYITTKIRGLCRDAFEMAIPNIAGIAKGEHETASANAQIRALDSLGRYGLGKQPVHVLMDQEWAGHFFRIAARHFGNAEKYEAFYVELTATLTYRE
jgi:hypothetical protein